MKKWLLAVVGLAVVSAGASAQDVKSGQEKVAFEKKSYPYEGEVTVERLNVRMFPKNDQTSIITSVLGLGEKVTVVAEKKVPAKKGEAPALDASDIEAKQLIANAERELNKQRQLVEAGKVDKVEFGTIVADYEAAKAKAQTEGVRSEADRGLNR